MLKCATEDCTSLSYCKGICRPCYMKAYRQLPKQKAQRQEWHKKHYQEKKDIYLKARERYSKKHAEKRRAEFQEFLQKFKKSDKYKSYVNAVSLARHKRIRKSTPPWVCKKELKNFYQNRPPGYHVDHIIPLNGKNVCGLTVLWNLQYLPKEVNLKKSNKVLNA